MITDEDIGWLIAERDLALEERDEARSQLEKLRKGDGPVVIDFARSKETRAYLIEQLRAEIRKEFENDILKMRHALKLAQTELKRLQTEKIK